MKGNYLFRTSSGQYRFRIRIPTYLTKELGKREIRESLDTDSRQLAELLASRKAAEYKLAFAAMKKKRKRIKTKPDDSSLGLITFLDSEDREVKVDFGGDVDQELRAAKELMAHSSTLTQHRPTSQPKTSLSEALKLYLSEKKSRGLEERSILDYETMLRDFIALHGDTPLEKVTRDSTVKAYSKFKRLPSNRNKKPEYKGKSLDEILEMPGIQPMSKSTSRKFITRVSQFFNWCVQWEKMNKNPAAGLVERKSDDSDDRHPFTDADLHNLFSRREYLNRTFERPYQFWVPLIALFTGARINEICQLRTEDILVEEGTTCIYFTGEAGRLKTHASKRLTPVHDQLISVGFLDFVAEMRRKGGDRLFPELADGREGPGQTASKWFSRYKKRCGIDSTKKTFHSFRHTVATRLSYTGCQDYEIADVLGHKTSTISTSRYRERLLPHHLYKTIHKLDFSFITIGIRQ